MALEAHHKNGDPTQQDFDASAHPEDLAGAISGQVDEEGDAPSGPIVSTDDILVFEQ